MKELTSVFLDSSSPGDFVSGAFDFKKKSIRSFTYQTFAEKAGFSSRSYAHLLVSGKRSVSLKNVDKIVKGFELAAPLSSCLKLWVEGLQLGWDGDRLERLDKLKKRLVRLQESSGKKQLLRTEWPIVYAALGSPEEGATKERIAELTGYEDERLDQVLESMESSSLLKFDEEKGAYFALTPSVMVEELNDNEVFRRLYNSVLSQVRNSVTYEAGSPDTMFFTSAVSVKKSNLPKLNSELQKVVARYTEEIEDSDGDQIALIQTAMIPHQPN